MTTYAIDDVTGPYGSPTQVGAPDLGTLPAVSASTPASLASDEDSGGWEHAWWKLTAPGAGSRVVDVTLSYDVNGIPLPSYADVFTFNGTDYDFWDGINNTGIIEFEAATDYYVSVGRTFGDGDGSSFMVLRVGDLGDPPTAWIQGDDTQWVTSHADNLVTADPNPVGGVTGSRWSNGVWLDSETFHGQYEFTQAFAGPNPQEDSATYSPLWRNARAGQAGIQYWSEDPTNPDLGTYAVWHGGPGTPIIHEGEDLPGTHDGFDIGLAGSIYDADQHGVIPGADVIDTYASSWRLSLSLIVSDFGPSGGRSVTPVDDGLPVDFAGDFEWEDPTCSLASLEATPDESVDGAKVGTVNWYLKAVPTKDGDGWGPSSIDPSDSTYATSQPGWQGGLDGPDGFVGRQTQAITGFSGSLMSWTAVDDGLLADAFAAEADTSNPGGLRAVCLHSDMLSPSLPGDLTPSGLVTEHIDASRAQETLALRITLTPSPHRWIPDPVLPEVEIVVRSITGEPGPQRARFASKRRS